MTTFNKTETLEILKILQSNGLLSGDCLDNEVFKPGVLSLFTFTDQSVAEDKCCARTAGGGQCTKKRFSGDFCKSHARGLEECRPTKNWPNPTETTKCVGCSKHAGFLVGHTHFWEHCGRVDVDVPDWHWMKTGKGFNVKNYLCIETEKMDERISECLEFNCPTCHESSEACACNYSSGEDEEE